MGSMAGADPGLVGFGRVYGDGSGIGASLRGSMDLGAVGGPAPPRRPPRLAPLQSTGGTLPSITNPLEVPRYAPPAGGQRSSLDLGVGGGGGLSPLRGEVRQF